MRDIYTPKSYLSELSPLLTYDQVGALLHLSRRRIGQMLSQGRLRGPKITRSSGPGGRRLILRDSVETLIRAGMDAE